MAGKKTQTPGDHPAESAVENGAEAVRDGFEKALAAYDQFVTFSKDNAEALLKSANAAGKGFENLHSEVLAYTRRFIEDGVSATKAVLAARSVEEAFHLQGEFGKTLFQAQVDQAAKIGELALSTAREAAEPFQSRVAATAEFARTA
jgi:phasin family protein